jgi:hypothetical protein
MLRIIAFAAIGYLILTYAYYTYLHIKTPGVSPLKVLFREMWRELKFFLLWPLIIGFAVTVKVLFACVGPPLEIYSKWRQSARKKTVSD